MSQASLDANKVIAASRSCQWLVAVFFICWTLLAAVAVWWLISDAAKSSNTVIRVNAGEARLECSPPRDRGMARLNFPWALAWIF
jgi:hypothetical protein